jgi:hypothetical protein
METQQRPSPPDRGAQLVQVLDVDVVQHAGAIRVDDIAPPAQHRGKRCTHGGGRVESERGNHRLTGAMTRCDHGRGRGGVHVAHRAHRVVEHRRAAPAVAFVAADRGDHHTQRQRRGTIAGQSLSSDYI